MIITIMLTVVCILSLILGLTAGKNSKELTPEEGFMLFMLFIWVINFTILAMNPVGVRIQIAEVEAVRETLESARKNTNISSLELIKVQDEVLELNRWIARSQFKANMLLTNWYYPKEIQEVMLIK